MLHLSITCAGRSWLRMFETVETLRTTDGFSRIPLNNEPNSADLICCSASKGKRPPKRLMSAVLANHLNEYNECKRLKWPVPCGTGPQLAQRSLEVWDAANAPGRFCQRSRKVFATEAWCSTGICLESAWNLLGCSNGCTVHCTDITDNVKEWFGMVHKLHKVLLCPWQSIASRQHSKAARFLQPAFLPTLPTHACLLPSFEHHETVRTCAMSPASKRKNSSRWESVPTSTTRDRSFCSKSNSFRWRITVQVHPSTAWSCPDPNHTQGAVLKSVQSCTVGAPKYAQRLKETHPKHLQGLHCCTVGILCEGSERWQRRVWIAHSGPIVSNPRASDFLVTPNKRSNSETSLCSLYLRKFGKSMAGTRSRVPMALLKNEIILFSTSYNASKHLYLIIYIYILSVSISICRIWTAVVFCIFMILHVSVCQGAERALCHHLAHRSSRASSSRARYDTKGAG